jgi:uncharacterized membrane protein
MLNIDFDGSKRVAVPAEALWQEIFPLSHLLRLVPELVDVEVLGEDRRAFAQISFVVGTIKWNAVTEAKIDVAEAPSLLQWTVIIPSMRVELVGEIRIEDKGDHAILRYECELACENRFLSRIMKATLIGMLEDHVDHVLEEAADAATKHVEAARRLSKAGREER